MEKRYLTNYKK